MLGRPERRRVYLKHTAGSGCQRLGDSRIVCGGFTTRFQSSWNGQAYCRDMIHAHLVHLHLATKTAALQATLFFHSLRDSKL